MGDLVPSLIRTWVPIGIGTVLAFLAREWGIVIDEDTSANLTLGFGALVMGIYYAAVRFLGKRYPQIEWLLGLAKQPGYSPKEPPDGPPSGSVG